MSDPKTPRATHVGTLHVGAIELPCYVLEDGRRVVTQKAAHYALAMPRPSVRSHGDEPTSFLGSSAMQPYSGAALTTAANAAKFTLPQGGATATGFDARFLVEAARAIDDADRAGALGSRQARAVVAARTILHALAGVGLDALIDEACGLTRTNHAEDMRAYVDDALKAQAKLFGAKLAESDARIGALTAALDAKDEVELEFVGQLTFSRSLAGRVMREGRDLSPEARKVIEQRRAEAQERRDKRRGQTYIFTLRRPRPSEMAAPSRASTN